MKTFNFHETMALFFGLFLVVPIIHVLAWATSIMPWTAQSTMMVVMSVMGLCCVICAVGLAPTRRSK